MRLCLLIEKVDESKFKSSGFALMTHAENFAKNKSRGSYRKTGYKIRKFFPAPQADYGPSGL